DYLTVFTTITIISRVKKLEELPEGFLKTTGHNLNFVNVTDQRGLKWVVLNKRYLHKSGLDLSKYDAICYRIPSVLSNSVWSKAKKYNIPHMFEMIGHPTES